MRKLEGKIALVTGGAGGQGAAEAKLFAANGATVIVADMNEDGLADVVKAITANGGKGESVVIDVAQAESWKRAVSLIKEKHGRLDILVNNAGVLSEANILNLEEPEWDRTIAINQKGVWLGMKYSAPLMMVSGNGGAIVNTSSIYAHIGSGGSVAYQASKGAVFIMTRTAATEFAPHKIRVNSVAPGFIATAMTTDVIAKFGDEHPDIKRSLLKRTGTAQEIAHGVLFLVSDDAGFITGTELLIDGGRSIT